MHVLLHSNPDFANILIASGDGTDEDFSWEDEEEEDESANTPEAGEAKNKPAPIDTVSGTLNGRSSHDTLQPSAEKAHGTHGSTSYPESLVNSPSFTGSRASSDGYDVVSSGHGSSGSGPEAKKGEPAKASKEEEEDGDSDWE